MVDALVQVREEFEVQNVKAAKALLFLAEMKVKFDNTPDSRKLIVRMSTKTKTVVVRIDVIKDVLNAPIIIEPVFSAHRTKFTNKYALTSVVCDMGVKGKLNALLREAHERCAELEDAQTDRKMRSQLWRAENCLRRALAMGATKKDIRAVLKQVEGEIDAREIHNA
jgi:hypothetical protein